MKIKSIVQLCFWSISSANNNKNIMLCWCYENITSKSGVGNVGPGVPMSCRVQLQLWRNPHLPVAFSNPEDLD